MASKTIVGRLGKVPEVRAAGSGHVAAFSVAETKRKKNPQTGQWEDDFTIWHDVEAWQAADQIALIPKGALVIVEGEERDASYENRDGKKVSRTIVRARTVGMVVRDAPVQSSGDSWAPAQSYGGDF